VRLCEQREQRVEKWIVGFYESKQRPRLRWKRVLKLFGIQLKLQTYEEFRAEFDPKKSFPHGIDGHFVSISYYNQILIGSKTRESLEKIISLAQVAKANNELVMLTAEHCELLFGIDDPPMTLEERIRADADSELSAFVGS